MNLFRISIFTIGSLAAFASLYAQETLPEKEEDIPVEFIPTLNTSVSVGMHRIKGTSVRFGNLGSIPIKSPDNLDYPAKKTYSNGSITQDTPLGGEVNADGSSLLPVGSRRETVGGLVVVSQEGGNRVVTIYSAVGVPKLKADGTPDSFYNAATGTTGYIRATTPEVILGSDGNPYTVDNPVQVWASTAKYLGYDQNQSRFWSVNDTSQLNKANHQVTMNSYGASTMGESKKVDDANSTGFEVTLDRMLGRRGKLEWGIAGSLKLDQVNAKTSGDVNAHVVNREDVYSLVKTSLNSAIWDSADWTQPDPFNGTTVAVGTTQPTAQSLALLTENGQKVYRFVSTYTAPSLYTPNGDKSIVLPISVHAVSRTIYDGKTSPETILYNDGSTQTINHAGYYKDSAEAVVHGYWQLKGAYYLMNIGPSLRYRFNDRWAVNGKLAFSIAYIGAVYTAEESFSAYNDVWTPNGSGGYKQTPLNVSSDNETLAIKEENNSHKILGGLYAELNAEYWVTERTGFYAGITYQSIRSFSPTPLGGRTANVNLGGDSGWHFGVITRF